MRDRHRDGSAGTLGTWVTFGDLDESRHLLKATGWLDDSRNHQCDTKMQYNSTRVRRLSSESISSWQKHKIFDVGYLIYSCNHIAANMFCQSILACCDQPEDAKYADNIVSGLHKSVHLRSPHYNNAVALMSQCKKYWLNFESRTRLCLVWCESGKRSSQKVSLVDFRTGARFSQPKWTLMTSKFSLLVCHCEDWSAAELAQKNNSVIFQINLQWECQNNTVYFLLGS